MVGSSRVERRRRWESLREDLDFFCCTTAVDEVGTVVVEDEEERGGERESERGGVVLVEDEVESTVRGGLLAPDDRADWELAKVRLE